MEELNIIEESTSEPSRRLATIQTITELNPIENADAIEVASVLGWYVVVKKGEFKVGDKVVYIEIDSVLPEREWAEFLRKNNFRIKTVRLRGQVSQGICFPLSILESKVFGRTLSLKVNKETDNLEPHLNFQPIQSEDFFIEVPSLKIEDDTDVTEILGVTKYEPKVRGDAGFIGGRFKSNFPSFLIKTDETRVQSLTELLEKYKGTSCYITEKIDGCSATYFMKNGVFGVCSRNREVEEDDTNIFWNMAKKYELKEILNDMGGNNAIQGEIVGPKIQNNKLQLLEVDLKIFDIFDIDNYEYANYSKFCDFIEHYDLPQVPHLKLVNLNQSLDELVKLSTRKSKLNDKVWAEGIVIRSINNINDFELKRKMRSNRLSFKVINPEFLLKYD